MTSEFVFEACVDSLYSAVQAQKGGAGRLELCAALSQGGITPSYGLIKAVKKNVTIPIHVLIRPRAGDFCYMDSEVEVICEDIRMVGSLSVQGIAFGALNRDGEIDSKLMRLVVNLSREYGLSITFHRAFDVTCDAAKALEVLLELGIPRLLTSGQRENVTDGIPTIEKLLKQAKNRICIMPGGGVNETNAAEIVNKLRVNELHGSAKRAMEWGSASSTMFGGDIQLMATDCNLVNRIVKSCKQQHAC